MARIDQLRDRLRTLKEAKRTISDDSAKRQIDSAIKRTERQVAKEASKMGRPPRKGMRRSTGGRFSSGQGSGF